VLVYCIARFPEVLGTAVTVACVLASDVRRYDVLETPMRSSVIDRCTTMTHLSPELVRRYLR